MSRLREWYSYSMVVRPDGTVRDVQRAARESGHLRILVGDRSSVAGVVHVRDTLVADPDAPVGGFVRPAFELAADTPFAQGLEAMRRHRAHLAVVHGDGGRYLGVVTLADLMRVLFPETATG